MFGILLKNDFKEFEMNKDIQNKHFSGLENVEKLLIKVYCKDFSQK